MAGGSSSAIYPLCKDFNKCNGLSNRRGLLACDSKAYLSTLRWNAASNNCSDFRQPEFYGLEYLLVSPSTGTNRDHFLQADSRTYTQDAQLHYFRIADDSG